MRYCENCGNQLPVEQNSGFCGQCGFGFSEPSEPKPATVNPESSKRKGKKAIILMSVVLLLIIAVAGFALVHFLLQERGDGGLKELLVGRWAFYLESDLMEDDWFKVIEAEPEVPTVPDFAGEPVTIEFMWWGGGELNAIITLFEVANPEVTVVGTQIAHSDYWQRLHMQMAAGDPSTLFLMNSIYASQFTQQEFLADLEPFIAGGIIDVSGLDSSVVESGRVNGLQSMISGGISINGYISNATLLAEFGITPPGIGQDWSWDDFIFAGRTFADATAGTDKWFTFDESTEWFNFSSFVRQLDGDVFNPDGSLIVREERVTEWFTMWNMLRAEGIIPEAAISLRGKWDMFTIGDVAMGSWPASALLSFQDSMAGSELTISRIPTHGDQVQRGEVIISEYFSISAFASLAEQAAAARLINFFLNDREAVDLLGFSRGVPPNRVRAEEVRANLDLNPAENRVVDFVLDLSPIARTALHHPPDIGEISAIFNDIGNLVRQGELSPEEAAQQFIQEVRRLGW